MLAFYLSVISEESEKAEFERLYKEKKRRMFAVAMKYLHNSADAEDAVHEAFLRIASGGARLFSVAREKQNAFLDILIRNISVDMFKRKADYKPIEDEEIPDECSLEDSVIGEVSKEGIMRFILTLPEASRDALYLKTLVGLSYCEIAEKLSITEAAARQRVSSARKMVRAYIEREKCYE